MDASGEVAVVHNGILENYTTLRRDLLDNGVELIGVAVDRVIQVYRMEPEQVEYATAMSAELSDYVIGIGRVSQSGHEGDEDMLILIDPVSLLGG